MQQLTLQQFIVDDTCTTAIYDCNFNITTAGDGHWGCEAGRVVNVTAISIVTEVCSDYVNVQVNVTHNSTWDVYSDTAFSAAISDALNLQVSFTEQGMQEDCYASMEA